MIENIIQSARDKNKNILIIGSPRSGTHALASEITALSGAINQGEICKVGYCTDPWQDISQLNNMTRLTVAHIVQLTPKLTLAEDVDRIKQRNVIINIKRSNKVDQFASWIYFRVLDPTGLHGWHNHTAEKTRVAPNQIVASEQDIMQFKLEQLIDDYFLPDFKLHYEALAFDKQKKFKRNTFSFPLPQIFSNLDYVEQQLGSWKYSSNHFDNE